MMGFAELLILSVPTCLLAGGLIPTRWANRHPHAMRRGVSGLALLAFGLAVAAAVVLATQGPTDVSFFHLSPALPIGLGVYFDSLAAVMLLLVSFIGCVITRYSWTYLDGEPTQGRFMRWISFTLGAVLLLVVSGNLMMFTVAWVLTSLGLHQLLTHYRTRPAALLSARKKFLISRLGDALLVGALILTYRAFGSFEFGEIFAAAPLLGESSPDGRWMLSAIGALFVLGAITKSAQFPFHSWLPDTMETPTPVSALMHAGIINAGGFLVIRLSPVISQSHLPLDLLAVVGAITALFGAVVMLTQTSIKRSLAYSTIAQMGFMMLQCGLGAFSAALLHIVAHSLYKAHAFLSSGSVLNTAARGKLADRAVPGNFRSLLGLAGSAVVAVAICLAVSWSFGIRPDHKPGALVLGLILSIAITHLLWKSLRTRRWQVALGGLATAIIVCGGYCAAFVLMDGILASSVSHAVVRPSVFDAVLMLLVAAGFVGVFLLQLGLSHFQHSPLLKSLYVAAANGFYWDIAAQRITVQLWRRFTVPRKPVLAAETSGRQIVR